MNNFLSLMIIMSFIYLLFFLCNCTCMLSKTCLCLCLCHCRGLPGVRPVDGHPFKEVEVGDCVLEAVDRFCYLGDMLSAGGGCMAAATARCRCAWGKFRENLPLLTSKPVPFDLRGRLFSSNVRSSMLHGTETWPMTSAALHQVCRNDRAMICWIFGVKPSDNPSIDELHAKLGICDLAILVRERRLRWFGHVMHSNGEINRVRSRPVPGRKGPARPKNIWEECFTWSKIWKYVVYLRPALRIDCRGDHLWRTVDRSLPRLTGAFLRAWLGLRHSAFWGCAHAPLTKLDLIDWLIDWDRSNAQFPGLLVISYGRNWTKFVIYISVLWYPQKWKRLILAQ